MGAYLAARTRPRSARLGARRDLARGQQADLAHADAVVAVVLAEVVPAAALVRGQAGDPVPLRERAVRIRPMVVAGPVRPARSGTPMADEDEVVGERVRLPAVRRRDTTSRQLTATLRALTYRARSRSSFSGQ